MKNLWELVDTEKLQDIQDQFAEATEVAVIICDAGGNPITKPSNFTNFCNYIRSCEEGLKRCILSDERVGKMAAERNQPVIHRCHTGLIDFAAPIVLREKYLGSVLCGQLLIDKEEVEDIPDMSMETGELDLEQETMHSLYRQLEHKSHSRVKAIAQLLFLTANYIVEIGDAYLIKKELAVKNEKLFTELQLRANLEKTLKETQLKVLQSQVNPHFLFNTLNTISRIAYLEGSNQTQDVTYLLSKILRYSLRNIDQLVPLKEEIEHVRNYIRIQQTRFPGKLRLEIQEYEPLENYHIPIFTLQPLVENAVVHGFEPVGLPMKISVTFIRKDDKFIINIMDDGKGVTKEELEISNVPLPTGKGHTTGLGIQNVDKRLKHYFGDTWGIHVQRRGEKKGTMVQIQLPNHLLAEM
ncbi:sensor histidine kinase [Bacillus sp. FJAT-44742]|uniref:sensor histidine kinase n=1 Tax=Bacillus sp. FJAT-44742 TaxID=2014005 RepID=UPI0022B7EFC0|nr:PocR ligand-binding domain-containing protein [Bacillus sp. FJAT-44742]